MTNEKFNTIIRVLQKTLKPKNITLELGGLTTTIYKRQHNKVVLEFWRKDTCFNIASLTFSWVPIAKDNKFYIDLELDSDDLDDNPFIVAEEKELMKKIVKHFKDEE